MGQYMNPKKIEGQQRLFSLAHAETVEGKHADFMRQASGMLLVAHCDRGFFTLAANVTKVEEFEELYSQYRQGMLLSFDVYAVDPMYFAANRSS